MNLAPWLQDLRQRRHETYKRLVDSGEANFNLSIGTDGFIIVDLKTPQAACLKRQLKSILTVANMDKNRAHCIAIRDGPAVKRQMAVVLITKTIGILGKTLCGGSSHQSHLIVPAEEPAPEFL